MPVQQGIVGPIPERADAEEYDKLRRRVLWRMPSGLYVIGSRHGDRLNLMTANWVTQVSFDPKLVAVSVENEALTHALIHEGSAFAAEHGSWNRNLRTGYKVIRVPFKPDGTAVGSYEDFLTGFVTDEGYAWGRPVGVAVAKDGALLVSDDGSNTIWRVAKSVK